MDVDGYVRFGWGRFFGLYEPPASLHSASPFCGEKGGGFASPPAHTALAGMGLNPHPYVVPPSLCERGWASLSASTLPIRRKPIPVHDLLNIQLRTAQLVRGVGRQDRCRGVQGRPIAVPSLRSVVVNGGNPQRWRPVSKRAGQNPATAVLAPAHSPTMVT